MSDQTCKKQMELAKTIEKFSKHEGAHITAIPSLFFVRRSNVTELNHTIYRPCLCIIVQGAKEVYLAQERFKYSPSNYLVASVNLPISGKVTEASSDVPYLAITLEFTPNQILEVISDFKIKGEKRKMLSVVSL